MLYRTVTLLFALTALLNLPSAVVAQTIVAKPPASSEFIQRDPLPRQQPETILGHDQFGYEWSDAPALSWIDATSGTLAISSNGGYYMHGPFTLPFTFTYYNQSFDSFYLSWSGFLSFMPGPANQPSNLPSTNTPNTIIAPYIANFGQDIGGGVYYTSGGSAPNRYMVIEWHNMPGYAYFPISGNTTGRYQFEAILYENGDIKLQYQIITPKTGFYLTAPVDSCATIGMEDGVGKDGVRLQPTTCYPALANKAILIKRPPNQGRLWLANQSLEGLMTAGSSKTFAFTVQNTGDLGADAYDLFIATGWPATLYMADGSTALTDTSGNGVIDTGAIAPNATQTYTVRIAAPANLGAGQWNAATMTVRSTKTPAISQNIKIQTTLPAPIALAFTTGGSAQMNTLLASPGNQHVITQTISETLSLVSAIARRPNGGFVQTITTRTCDKIGSCDMFSYTWRLYVAFIDKTGQIEKIITATEEVAVGPSIAIAPNGNILLAWSNNLGSTGSFIFQDVAYLVLDPQGNILKPSTSLAGLANPFSNGYAGSTNVVATGDGNFVVGWFRAYDTTDNNSNPCKRNSFDRPCPLIDIYYSVFDSTGAVVKAAARLTADTPSKLDSYSSAALASQSNNHIVFSLVRTDAQTQTLQLGQMDSVGHVTISPTIISTRTSPIGWMDTPKLIELSTGRVLLGWFQRNDGSAPTLQIMSFDATLGTKLGPTVIPNPEEDSASPCCISFAADAFGHASMVWTNSFDSYSQRGFYMLVDQTGQIITPRTTLFDTVNSLISLPGNFKNINTNGFAIASASADAAIQIFVPMSLH